MALLLFPCIVVVVESFLCSFAKNNALYFVVVKVREEAKMFEKTAVMERFCFRSRLPAVSNTERCSSSDSMRSASNSFVIKTDYPRVFFFSLIL